MSVYVAELKALPQWMILPLWRFEDHVDTYPTKDPALSFSGQKAIQVEEPDPQVDLNLGACGPALVGEKFIVPVTVTSKGHAIYAGELKINLVDAKGGFLVSPRDMEPMSKDDHHVELTGIAGPEGEDECQTGPDNIRKIQHSFGLVSVPFLNCGDSWTCKLEIKWHRPKSVMLYVSLGYSLHSNESTSQKVHIHKSLQIEGKTAIVVGHRFMLPFRQDPLLLPRMKPLPDADQLASLPLNEKVFSLLMQGTALIIRHGGEDIVAPTLLVPGEEFKKVFHVIPEVKSSKLSIGTVFLRWRRECGIKEQSSCNTEAAGVLTKHGLPDVNVELSPLIVRLECPPHAILGVPFTYIIKIQNQTHLLQEIKFSLGDSPSFVLSGSHNDTIFVIPKTEHSLSYMLVPLASGSQQLPRVTVTSETMQWSPLQPNKSQSGILKSSAEASKPSLHGTFWCWTRPGFLGRLLLGTLGPLSRLPLAHFGGFGIVTTASGRGEGKGYLTGSLEALPLADGR
ncbi:hypothetical protein CK203_077407 [Vitis vinifera]|uniref:Trafficking protein particle complex subunit 11 n=1 Tax=Vitis vinifera TaxID=29760 RepID=A0A438D224_VITVI|nr:hypothetical protein CK203_077407 [Vitis vinifera]